MSAKDAIKLTDLVAMWTEVMPPLKDQGEADRINLLLGNLLHALERHGYAVPAPVFVADAPADPERAALIQSDAVIRAEFFTSIYTRYDKSQVFRRFWNSLSDDEKRTYWQELA